MTDPGDIRVRLPAVLSELAGDVRVLVVDASPTTVGELLDALTLTNPALVRRIRDESGAVRRHVNLYVDGSDIRHTAGLDTALAAGAEVEVLPSIAGG